jgi:hypothetical protein
MATTGMLTGNASTVKLWQLKTWRDSYWKSWFGHFFETGTVYESPDLDGRKAGDQVTVSFTPILTGIGVGEGGTLVGNEEALQIKTDSFVINVFRHAVLSPAKSSIEQQRTNVQFETESRTKLPGHLTSRMDMSFFVQAAGCLSTTITCDGTTYTGSNLTFVRGMNTPTAPTSNRIVRAGGAANDQSITSSDTATLDLLDDLLTLIKGTYPHFEPLDGNKFAWVVPPKVTRDLKRDTTGRIQWYQMNIAAMTGGQIDNNKILTANGWGTDPIGRYADVEIFESTRVAPGVNGSTNAPVSNVYRTVLLGKNGLIYGSPFGRMKGYGEEDQVNPPFEFVDQLSDYGYYKGIGYLTIYGLKKIVLNSEDYGVGVISVYAA